MEARPREEVQVNFGVGASIDDGARLIWKPNARPLRKQVLGSGSAPSHLPLLAHAPVDQLIDGALYMGGRDTLSVPVRFCVSPAFHQNCESSHVFGMKFLNLGDSLVEAILMDLLFGNRCIINQNERSADLTNLRPRLAKRQSEPVFS